MLAHALAYLASMTYFESAARSCGGTYQRWLELRASQELEASAAEPAFHPGRRASSSSFSVGLVGPRSVVLLSVLGGLPSQGYPHTV